MNFWGIIINDRKKFKDYCFIFTLIFFCLHTHIHAYNIYKIICKTKVFLAGGSYYKAVPLTPLLAVLSSKTLSFSGSLSPLWRKQSSGQGAQYSLVLMCWIHWSNCQNSLLNSHFQLHYIKKNQTKPKSLSYAAMEWTNVMLLLPNPCAYYSQYRKNAVGENIFITSTNFFPFCHQLNVVW